MSQPGGGGAGNPLAWIALICLGLIAAGGALVSFGKIDLGQPPRKNLPDPTQAERNRREQAPQAEGPLDIRTTPAGAHVYIELSGHRANTPQYRYLGLTPHRSKQPIGTYKFVLFHGGTLVERELVVTPGGERSSLELRLPVERHPEMVLVPAGWSQLGSEKGAPDERPQRRVWLDAYYIDRCEVSNKRYALFLTYLGALQDAAHRDCHRDEIKNKQHEPTKLRSIFSEQGRLPFNRAGQPVAAIDWYDAYAYAHWAGKRLPTEAEWEKAASWNDQRKIKYDYPWGAEDDSSRAHVDKQTGAPADVEAYPQGKSPAGCLQMIGNVFEWVDDWWSHNAYRELQVKNPRGPQKGRWKVIRGGSGNFFHFQSDMRRTTYSRFKVIPGLLDPNIGFRCALSAK